MQVRTQQIFLTDPKTPQPIKQELQNANNNSGAWENFNKVLSKNKNKAKKVKFQIKYKQFLNRKKGAPFSEKSTQNNSDYFMPSIRILVKEKHNEEDQLRKTISQYNYHLSDKQRTLRAFKIASQKHKKIITVRKNRLKDLIQLNNEKALYQSQINSEKQLLFSLSKSGKHTRYKSLEKQLFKKRSIAQQVRAQSHFNKIKVSQQQFQKLELLKQRYKTQKSQEKMASLKSVQLMEMKKIDAEKMRNERLTYQIRERNLIHKQRVSFYRKTNRKIKFMKTITDGLNKKIEQFRVFSKQQYPRRNKSLQIDTKG